MKRKTLLSWSSGKDSAWALHLLRQNPEIELVGLFCTVNQEFDRVAMHAVRVELLHKQAESIGLPLEVIQIPYPCSNTEYEAIMEKFVAGAKKNKIEYFAFGDLFLEDIRKYREEKLQGTGIEPLFPLWGIPTAELASQIIAGGVKTVITCIDPNQIPEEFIGREYDQDFLNDLPLGVDPCGENGEFHTFVYDGPMFAEKMNVSIGEIVHRDGFVFVDVQPDNA